MKAYARMISDVQYKCALKSLPLNVNNITVERHNITIVGEPAQELINAREIFWNKALS